MTTTCTHGATLHYGSGTRATLDSATRGHSDTTRPWMEANRCGMMSCRARIIACLEDLDRRHFFFYDLNRRRMSDDGHGEHKKAWQMQEEREGEASNPGPDPWSCSIVGQLILEAINITALSTKQQQLHERMAHVTCFEEHGAVGKAATAAIQAARERGWIMELGVVDPEFGRNTGGVGIQTRLPLRPLPHKACTAAFTDAMATGRVNIYDLDVDGVVLTIAIIYGWTGAVKGNVACDRTEDLITVVRMEFAEQLVGPKMIAGDVNGDGEIFESLADMIQNEGWTDLGAKADILPAGGIAMQPTCHANAGAKETRRDYIFANEYLFPAVDGFRVQVSDDFPTHKPVQVRIATDTLITIQRKLRKPDSAAEAVQLQIEEAMESLEGKEKHDEKEKQMDKLHTYMDNEASSRYYRLCDAVARRNGEKLWDLITACAEAAFISYLELEGPAAARMRGRGKVEIKEKKLEPNNERSMAPLTTQGAHARRNAGKHNGQANRLTNVARRMQVANAAGTSREKKNTNSQYNEATWKAYCEQALLMNKAEADCRGSPPSPLGEQDVADGGGGRGVYDLGDEVMQSCLREIRSAFRRNCACCKSNADSKKACRRSKEA